MICETFIEKILENVDFHIGLEAIKGVVNPTSINTSLSVCLKAMNQAVAVQDHEWLAYQYEEELDEPLPADLDNHMKD